MFKQEVVNKFEEEVGSEIQVVNTFKLYKPKRRRGIAANILLGRGASPGKVRGNFTGANTVQLLL